MFLLHHLDIDHVGTQLEGRNSCPWLLPFECYFHVYFVSNKVLSHLTTVALVRMLVTFTYPVNTLADEQD